MALGAPNPDDGTDAEPDEPEFDEDDEPEFDEPEPEFEDEDEPEFEFDEPEPAAADPEPAEFPPLAWADDPVLLLLLLCAAAGSSTITTPATATPTIPALAVTLRSRRRAWSRAKMADTVRSSLFIPGGSSFAGSTPSVSAALI